MSDSEFFDEIGVSDESNEDNKNYKNHNNHKKIKSISTSDFILILLFIFVSVVLGLFVKYKYFN